MTACIFLSYSSADAPEVNLLDLELRRRGVPLWRDRSDLAIGRPSAVEIDRAGREAAGLVVYLTANAAQSEWVREHELSVAQNNAQRFPAFGIVPIFRGDIHQVSEEMVSLGKKPKAPDGSSPYDLRGFNGYIVDWDRAKQGFLREELSAAADRVLSCLLDSLAQTRRGMGCLRIGAITRQASLGAHDVDLLLDLREDFPRGGPIPDPAQCEAHLLPALGSLEKHLSRSWPSLELRLILQCHLTLALALGFQFRRNTGASLEAVEIHSGDIWPGPKVPLPPAHDLWTVTEDALAGGPDLAVAVGVSGPIVKEVQGALKDHGIRAAHLLRFEPVRGASKTALQGIDREAPHRMAVAVAERLTIARAERGYRTVHLFYAGPPALAALLAQQLSNVGTIQTYEWLDGASCYRPTFQLVS